MNSFPEDSPWNLIDYTRLYEDPSSNDLLWCSNQSACTELDVSAAGAGPVEKGCAKKRGRNESCGGLGSKACREKMRRDKLNDRFADLSSALEPGRPAKTDKSAILSDAIRVLNQLRTESQELKEANEKLQEDIKNLKAEKNELREEKNLLKADKERIEQQMKAMAIVPGGIVPPHPATYQAGVNKFMAFPSYGGYPMWQYIPPASLDTSQDHVLRPPVA
uniref:BHLH transcriptional factor n=1 Tax=Coptis japonica TaxID=3442 RepID=E3WDH3_COPJA|nr:bHLH transcriptional factor [Coptis japonica]